MNGISFYEQLFLGPLLLVPRRKSWRSEDPGKEVFFNVGFQLACTRLSVSANKRKMRASSHSKRAKNSRRKKGRACNHTSIHPYLVCNTVVLGSSRNSLKNGCVTDYPLPRPLPEKPFSCQNVKCQNVQRCGVGGFHQLNLFVRHCEREAK